MKTTRKHTANPNYLLQMEEGKIEASEFFGAVNEEMFSRDVTEAVTRVHVYFIHTDDLCKSALVESEKLLLLLCLS